MNNLPENKQISVGTRLGTMLLDHVFMTMVMMVFFLPVIIADLSQAFTVSHEGSGAGFIGGPWQYMAILGFALYFCKDIINGRSIAKRILKLQLVDNATGQVANPLQCVVRNLLCILWPLEVIVAMVNTGRRLGDRVAGTRLVKYDPSLAQPKINMGKTILSIAISYGFVLFLWQLLPKVGRSGVNYSINSYNQNESRELEKVITDSLGSSLIPDIRVYDTIKNSNLKYVSAIFKLKQNDIEDSASYKNLNAVLTNLIYSKFPKNLFTGVVKYIYESPGQFHSRSIIIGTTVGPGNSK